MRFELRLLHRSSIHLDGGALHRSRVDERLRRNGRDRVDVGRVDVADVGGRRIVVDIRNVVHVHNGIGHVDLREVFAARRVRRPIDVAWTQREPANTTADAERQRSAPVIAADESDERRRIHRTYPARTWHPAPLALHERPASVVEWRKAPRRIVDPGPTPRIDPRPATIAVRSPVDGDGRRHPHGSVRGIVAPCSIGVEIRIADHLG